MTPEVKLKLYEAAQDSVGIYPAAIAGEYEQRSPYQEGWNAALSEQVRIQCVLTGWYSSLSPDIEPIIGKLLLIDEVMVSERDGKVRLLVNCSDLFAWATADAEELPDDQLATFAEMAKEKYGSDKWCCIQRNMQPQRPVVDRWKEEGVWDDQMESLPHNAYDGACEPTCSIHRPEEAARLKAEQEGGDASDERGNP